MYKYHRGREKLNRAEKRKEIPNGWMSSSTSSKNHMETAEGYNMPKKLVQKHKIIQYILK